jgi:hypothetical protein
MKIIESLFQLLLVWRLLSADDDVVAVAAAKKTAHYVTRRSVVPATYASSATTAAAAASSSSAAWLRPSSFASNLFATLASPPSPSSASTARSSSSSSSSIRRHLSRVDRWAPPPPVSDQEAGVDEAQGASSWEAEAVRSNPYAAFPVTGVPSTPAILGRAADVDLKKSGSSNATNVTEPDPNLETITPEEFKNKTAFEKNSTNNNATTTTSTKNGDDDDNDSTNNGSGIPLPVLLPPEKEQPTSWYMSVGIIFLALATILCTATCCRVCRNKNRRRDYEPVPY